MSISTVRIKYALDRKLANSVGYTSELYLLGANRNGTIDCAEKLDYDDADGCDFMRGVTSESIAKAYIKMLKKKKMTMVGFANLVGGYAADELLGLNVDEEEETYPHDFSTWPELMGDAPHYFPHLIFLIYVDNVTHAYQSVIGDHCIKRLNIKRIN